MLDSIEIETAPNPRWAVLWLHGLGADGHDFEPIVPQLVAPDWPPIRFIFPHAPVRPVTVNGGMRMRAWYDISGTELANKQDETGIRASMQQIDDLLAREHERGIASERQVGTSLTSTPPTSSRSYARCTSDSSFVHTPACSPKRPAFTAASASSNLS